MRRVLFALLMGIALMGAGFLALQSESNHVYGGSSHDYLFQFLSGLGLFLLFVALLLFLGTSAYIARKLSAVMSFLAGIAVLLAAIESWRIVEPIVNPHYWTLSLLVVPLTCISSGAVLSVVGAIRLIVPRLNRQ